MHSLNLNIVKWGPQANLLDFTATSIQASSSWLAIGYIIGSIALFSFETSTAHNTACISKFSPKALILGHTSEVISLLKFPDSPLTLENIPYSDLLLSICSDGDIAIWSAKDGICINRIKQKLSNILPTSGFLYLNKKAGENIGLLFVLGQTNQICILDVFSLTPLYIWKPQLDCIKSLFVHSYSKQPDNIVSEMVLCLTEKEYIKIYEFDSFKLRRSGYITDSELENLELASKTIFNPAESFFCHEKNQYNSKLIVNHFNSAEFLLISDHFVRMFELSGNELYEKIRWNSPASSLNKFGGAEFVSLKSFILWNSSGDNVLIDLSTKKNDSTSLYINCDTQNLYNEISSKNSPSGIFLSYYCDNGWKYLSSQLIFHRDVSGGNALAFDCASALNTDNIRNSREDAGLSSDEYVLGKIDYNLSKMWLRGHSIPKIKDEVSCRLICDEKYMILGLANGDIVITDIINGLWPLESVCNYYFEENIVLKGHCSEVTALCQWNRSQGEADNLRGSDVKKSLYNNIEKETFLISASKDLKVIIFDLKSCESLAEIPLLMSPIVSFFVIENEKTSQGLSKPQTSNNFQIESLIVCVGMDNSVVVISLITLQVELIYPPSQTPLISISYSSKTNKLQLTYQDYSKRFSTLDFITELHSDKSDEAIVVYNWVFQDTSKRIVYPKHEHWLTINSHKYLNFEKNYGSFSLANEVLDFDILNLEKVAVSGKLVGYNLSLAKVGLSMLLGWGLLGSIDSEVTQILGVNECNTEFPISLASVNYDMFTVLFPSPDDPKESWRQSSRFNAQRLLMILVYTKFIFQGNEKLVVCLINFYLITLPKIVGKGYKPADLYYLAKFFQHGRASVRDASRILIYSQVKKLELSSRKKLVNDCSAKLMNYASALVHSSKTIEADLPETLVVLSTIASHSPELLSVSTKSALATLLSVAIDFEEGADDEMLRDLCVEMLIIRNYDILISLSSSAKIVKDLLLQLFVKLLEQGLQKKRNGLKSQENQLQRLPKNASQRKAQNRTIESAIIAEDSIVEAQTTTGKHVTESLPASTSNPTLNIIQKLESPVLKDFSPTFEPNSFMRFIDVNYTEETFEMNQTIHLLKSALVHILVIDSNLPVASICDIICNQSTSSYELNFIIQILYYLMTKQPSLVYSHVQILCKSIVRACRNLYTGKNMDAKFHNAFQKVKNLGNTEEIEMFGLQIKNNSTSVAALFEQLNLPDSITKKKIFTSSKRLLAYTSMVFSTCSLIQGKFTFFAVGLPSGTIDVYDLSSYKLYTRVDVGMGTLICASLDGTHYLATLTNHENETGGSLSIWDLYGPKGIMTQLGLKFDMFSTFEARKNNYNSALEGVESQSNSQSNSSSRRNSESNMSSITVPIKSMKIPNIYLEPIKNMLPNTLGSKVSLTWKAKKTISLSITDAVFNLSI